MPFIIVILKNFTRIIQTFERDDIYTRTKHSLRAKSDHGTASIHITCLYRRGSTTCVFFVFFFARDCRPDNFRQYEERVYLFIPIYSDLQILSGLHDYTNQILIKLLSVMYNQCSTLTTQKRIHREK